MQAQDTSMRPRGLSAILAFAFAFALASCAPRYDCRTKSVQDRLFVILRDNFYDVLSKTDQPELKGLAVLAGFVGLVAGVAEMAQPDGVDEKSRSRILNQLRTFPETARFSVGSLTEDDSEKSREKHTCRANVHIEATIPEEFADALRQLPFLGINAKGEVSGNIDVGFTVQPDLSGKTDFVVRATW
jgi:hypothetical protein